jgi:UDP-2,3-diacylglucosamine pyrophosphatase LpxH
VATRTLVISDLHIGCRVRSSVLAQPRPLERLLAALEGIDRLVLLGDVVELVSVPAAQSMAEAAPILAAIGARMGPEREIVIVPGNHDRALVRTWARRHRHELSIDADVPPGATALLAELVGMLAPARVLVKYPGVWLRDGIWATHGHYLDRHLLPAGGYGILRSRLGRTPVGQATPLDYEVGRRPGLGLMTRWLPRRLAALMYDVTEVIRAATMPRVRRLVLNPRISPLTARLLSIQMRRQALPALVEVVQRLGVEADWVVFGHVHRLGPIAGDDISEWIAPGGSPRLLNSGSWLYEPLLVARARPPHPYWPGGAILLDGDAEPQMLSLLDDLGPADLK